MLFAWEMHSAFKSKIQSNIDMVRPHKTFLFNEVLQALQNLYTFDVAILKSSTKAKVKSDLT